MRSHYCGEINETLVDQNVTLCGWVHHRRDHGGVIFLDLREEMRKFVISIAQFSRKYRNDFRIIARGGLDLLVKRGVLDDQRISPARTYIRSLDGLIAEGVFSSLSHPEKPPPNSSPHLPGAHHHLQCCRAGLSSGLLLEPRPWL